MKWNWGDNFDRGPDRTDAHVEVREHDDRIVVVADIPDIETTDDIDVQCDGRNLRIATRDDSVDERVRLPAPVDETSATGTYNNGVMAVTFDRAASFRS